MNQSPASSDRNGRFLVACFVAVVFLALGILARSWNASILDRYEFRQLQTALTTHWIIEDSWKLAYPTPLFGPPWSVPMEFPTYQICVALVSEATGLALESAGRLTSILFLLTMLPGAFDLLAIAGLSRSRRLIVLMVILTTPVYLFYGRAFMIETAALCFGIWFLAFLRRSLTHRRWFWIVGTAILAAMAALTKITTFFVFGIPAAALVIASFLKPRDEAGALPRWRLVLAAGVPAVLALIVSIAWINFSDGIKDTNPFTGFLKSEELQKWNFGAASLRTDFSFWLRIQENFVKYVLAEGALGIALLCFMFAGRSMRIAAGVAFAAFLVGPMVFGNLYHIHDYYYAANAIFISGAAGLLLAVVWDDPRWPRGANWFALALILTFQLYAYYRDYFNNVRDHAPRPPQMAEIIRETVPTDGVLLIYGADWNPVIPYYAQRRAVMVPGQRENEKDVLEDVLKQLPPLRIAAMLTEGDKFRHRPEFIRERVARFGLAADPFAREGKMDLYLPAQDIASAAARVRQKNFQSADLLAMPVEDDFSTKLTAQPAATVALPTISPAPTAARGGYGLNLGDLNGRAVLHAHAPSEIVIPVKPGAKTINAVFGISEAAYAPGRDAVTDGISVEILETDPRGFKRVRFRRDLDPAKVPGDRGPQSIELKFTEALTGELTFRFGTGPKDNATNDWAYWARIEIR